MIKSVTATIILARLWKEPAVFHLISDKLSTQDAIVKWTLNYSQALIKSFHRFHSSSCDDEKVSVLFFLKHKAMLNWTMWCCCEPAFADYYSDEDLDNKWIRKRRRSCVNFTSQQTALLYELHRVSSFLAGLYCVFLVLITSQLEYLLPLPLANQSLIDQHVAGEI